MDGHNRHYKPFEDFTLRRIAHARVLFDDIVLSRLPPEPLLIKTRQLARLVHAEETGTWLRWELNGYPDESDLAVRYLENTGRLVDKKNWICYTQPLAELDRYVSAIEADMRERQNDTTARGGRTPEAAVALRAARVGEREATRRALLGSGPLREEIRRLTGIRRRVLAMVHEFVGSTYCTLVFSQLVEKCFDRRQAWVDAVLLDGAGDAVEEISAIYRRLSAKDREAIVQALKKVWNGQPLAWAANSGPPPDHGSESESGQAQLWSEAAAVTEETATQFNRVIRELLRGKINRNTSRHSRAASLLDIRKSTRQRLLPRFEKPVYRLAARNARML